MDKIQRALLLLNSLICEGWEFPDAEDKVSNLFDLNEGETEELRNLYDAS